MQRRKAFRKDYLIPTMDEFGVYPEVATAVGMKAIEQGVARKTMSRDELFAMAKEKIEYAHNMTKCLTDNKFIKLP